MKRIIWTLSLIGIFVLAACSSPQTNETPTGKPEATATQPVAATELPQPSETPALMIPVTGATVMPAPAIEEGATGSVAVNGLNLRIGPGLNYRVLALLVEDQLVRLQGRSVSGEWLAVRTPGGLDGWVYAAYLETTGDLASLPVLEAYGGPQVEQSQPVEETTLPEKYTFNMTIANNQADVNLTGFTASREITVQLAVRGGGPAMTVASGMTDSKGAAGFTFDMPYYWPDGSPITQNELKLTVAALDGSMTRSINVYYTSGW